MRTELLKNGKRVAVLSGNLTDDEVKAKNLAVDYDDVRLIDEAAEDAAFEKELADYRAIKAKLPPKIPKSVTKRQALLMLLDIGIKESDVIAIIDSINDSTEREKSRIEFLHASSIDRNHPLISVIANANGLSSDKVDDLFISAAKL